METANRKTVRGGNKKRILFLSNHFIGLYAYRRELIRELAAAGHEIWLSLPAHERNRYFEELGCRIVETPVSAHGKNPIRDVKLICTYRKLFREIDPDIILSYTIKPNIYGAMASHALGYRQVCNITGTGGTFLKNDLLAVFLRFLYRHSVRYADLVFFQNSGDRDYFARHRMICGNDVLLPGSGVNTEENFFSEMPDDREIRFIFAGRLIPLKGIDLYLESARRIRRRHPDTRFLVIGAPERKKYQKKIKRYEKEGWIEYLGYREPAGEWIRQCHCAVLPSLGGEGVPNVLLEASAIGRACIASRINGSADVVEDGVTGFLFETGNTEALIGTIEAFLALRTEERKAMGIAGHRKVVREFNRQTVIDRYLDEIER